MSQSIKFNDNKFLDATGVYDSALLKSQSTINGDVYSVHSYGVSDVLDFASGYSVVDYFSAIKIGKLMIVQLIINKIDATWSTLFTLKSGFRPPTGTIHANIGGTIYYIWTDGSVIANFTSTSPVGISLIYGLA